jgi:hypothetical protein
MADLLPDSRFNDDSAIAMQDGWTFSGESASSASSASQLDAKRSSTASVTGANRAPSDIDRSCTPDDPAADFALDRSEPGDTLARKLLATTEHNHTGDFLRSGERSPARSNDAASHRGEGTLLPGAEVAGFRILGELGRGAFARVYLAEELNLGGRLVAVKVSRADGDEPQILARLQHTHIVPVHSLHDDPDSGWRLLCMPYFGGADLARVLSAGGGLVPTNHDGGSLVKALDQVSRKPPERQRADSSQPTVRRLCSAPSRRTTRHDQRRSGCVACSRVWLAQCQPYRSHAILTYASPSSRRAGSWRAQAPSRLPFGSWRGWPRDSSMPTSAGCSIAT